MHYELFPTPDGHEWRVEAIGEYGEIYVASFWGADAEQRAREYWEWKQRD